MAAETNQPDASFRRHGLWALAGRLINIALVAGSAFVFARVMPSKADFGTFSYLQAVVTFLGIVAGVGSGTVAIRWVTEARHGRTSIAQPLKRIARTLSVAALVVGLITGIGLSIWQNATSPEETYAWWVFATVGFAVAMRGTHQFFAGAARAESRLKTANLLDGANGGPISNGLLLLGILTTACIVTVSWQRAVISLALANLVAAAVGIWLVRDLFRESAAKPTSPDEEDTPSPSMLAVGVPVAAASLLVFLVEQLDLLFAGWTLAEDALAEYSAAKRISFILRMPFAMVNMAVTGIITKRFIAGEHASLQSLLSGTATVSIIASLLCALPLFIAPQTMLWLGFGNGYQQAATTMCILLVGQLVIVLGGSCQQLLILTKHEGVALKVNSGAAALLIVLLVSFGGNAKFSSSEMIALCFTLTTLFRACVMWWFARRLTEINTAPSKLGAR
ncbi:MAG: oligosaccharide flippase family protein, partial [Planctomycetota bacterium]